MNIFRTHGNGRPRKCGADVLTSFPNAGIMIVESTSLSPKNTTPTEDLWTVFLVDDDPDDLALNARVLQSSPKIGEIIYITNGDQLFHELRARDFFTTTSPSAHSLIVLDIHMPGRNGIALLDNLKSSPYTENIPVVMLTGDYSTDNIEKSYFMKADAFITKPLSGDHIRHIDTVLDGSRKRKEIF